MFDHSNPSSTRFRLNGEYKPNEPMAHDFSKDEFGEAYQAYTELYPTYGGEGYPLLHYMAFNTNSLSLFVPVGMMIRNPPPLK